jgi:hypothetical protein
MIQRKGLNEVLAFYETMGLQPVAGAGRLHCGPHGRHCQRIRKTLPVFARPAYFRVKK